MKFCSACGHAVSLKTPDQDTIPRYVCDACGVIHYENPKIVVGCVVEHEGKILLCKRAIEPRYGYWTVPAGFMENEETLQEGAARETLEEALAEVEVGEMFAVVDVVRARQVHVMFRATLDRRRIRRRLREPGDPSCLPRTRSPGTISPSPACALPSRPGWKTVVADGRACCT